MNHRDTENTERPRKGIRFLVLSVSLWLILSPLAVSDDTPEQLRSKLAMETDLVRKARLAARLAVMEFDQARKDYSGGDADKGAAGLAEMMAHIELSNSSLKETKRNPRKNPSGFKDIEIKLRALNRRLDDLRASLPLDERPPVEKMVSRVTEIVEDLLHGLMNTAKGKKGFL